jgi:predicted exporter
VDEPALDLRPAWPRRDPARVSARHLPVLLWLLLMLAAALLVAQRLDIDDNLTVFLPRDSEPIHEVMLARLREGPAARLILVAFAGGDQDGRIAASRAAARALADQPGLARVLNGAQGLTPDLFDPLLPYRYLLAEPGPLDQAQLEKALAVRLQELGAPLGSLVESQLAADPTAQFRTLLLGWREGVQGPRRTRGVWVSATGERSLVLIETAAAGYALDRQAGLVRSLQAQLGEIAAEHGVTLEMAGSPVSTLQARDAVAYQMAFGAAATVAALAAMLLWVYRSSRILAIGGLVLATGMLAGLATVLLAFDAIHRIALAFGVTLLGIAIDYPLHLFSHARGDEPLTETAARISSPLLLGALTSIAAFALLGTSDFGGLIQLSLFTGAGLAASAAMVRWVVPLLMPADFHPAAPHPLLNLPMQPPRLARLGFIALAALAAGWLASQGDAIWERDFGALNPVPPAAKRLDGMLRAELGAPDLRHLFLIAADEPDAVLRASEAFEPELERLAAAGAIGSYDAPHRYLPSLETQARRQAALPAPATLAAALAAAQAGLPFKPDLFAPFLAEVEASRMLAPLDAAAGRALFEQTPLGARLDRLLVEHEGRWYAFLPLSAVQDLAALRAAAEPHPLVDYVDLKALSDASVTGFRDQALHRLGLGVALIVGLLLLARRPAATVVRIVLALAGAVALGAAALLLIGERFSLFHIMSGLIVVGVGLDYALFFSWHPEDADERQRTLQSVIVCAASTVLVFGLTAVSSIAVLRAIGLTAAIGCALAFIACYLLVAPDRTGRANEAAA